jgi:hypothetical protein
MTIASDPSGSDVSEFRRAACFTLFGDIVQDMQWEIRELKQELEYIDLDNSPLINDYIIHKPRRFKNKAHERGYAIALEMAGKEPAIMHRQRMGDMIIETRSPVIMTTNDCIDVMKYCGNPDIQLDKDAVNPRVVALDAMKYVPSFFDPGLVTLKQTKNKRKMWLLELTRK